MPEARPRPAAARVAVTTDAACASLASSSGLTEPTPCVRNMYRPRNAVVPGCQQTAPSQPLVTPGTRSSADGRPGQRRCAHRRRREVRAGEGLYAGGQTVPKADDHRAPHERRRAARLRTPSHHRPQAAKLAVRAGGEGLRRTMERESQPRLMSPTAVRKVGFRPKVS